MGRTPPLTKRLRPTCWLSFFARLSGGKEWQSNPPEASNASHWIRSPGAPPGCVSLPQACDSRNSQSSYRRSRLAQCYLRGSEHVMLVADSARELDTVKILKHFNCDRPADPRPIPEHGGRNRAAVFCRNLFGEGRMGA